MIKSFRSYLSEIVLGWFLGTNLGDFISTKIGLSFSNLSETNHFLVWLGMGSIWYVLFKLVFVSGAGYSIYYLSNRFSSKMILLSLFLTGLVFAYCIVNNISLILHYH